MNVHVLGLCLLAVAVTGDESLKRLDEKTIDNVILKFRKECIDETKLEKEVLDKALKSMMDTTNRKLQCYARCMMMKFKVMKDNGDYDVQILVDQMPLSRAKFFGDVVKRCNDEKQADHCERAMSVYACTQKVIGTNYQFS